MPIDYREYHPNFPARALALKEEADWTCQGCGRPCRKPWESVEAFVERLPGEGWEPKASLDRFPDRAPQRWTLTTHHPDHDKMNPEARLEVLCAPCHLRADHAHHMANARETRYRKRRERGQSMFDLEAV